MCDAPRSPSISYGSTAAETQAGSLPLPPSAISRAGSAASVHDDDSQVAVPSNAAAAHAFFHELFTSDEEERVRAVTSTSAKFRGVIVAAGSDSTAAAQLRSLLPTALRIAFECPFPEVRAAFTALFPDIERVLGTRLINRSPCISSFVHSNAEFAPNFSSSEIDAAHLSQLLTDVFVNNGRVSRLDVLLSCFPAVLESFVLSNEVMFHGSSPLPETWRYYIAIIAAARHACPPLLLILETDFLVHGGDREWLHGIHRAPPKLQRLGVFNALLAHTPWKLRPEDVELLMRRDDSWSQAELLDAIVILATVHSLASLTLGCGITMELDLLSLSAIAGDATSESSSEALSRDDETQRCETDAIYRMLSERPTSCDATDAAAAAAGRDAEFDRTQMEAASLQLQVLPSSQVSDSGRYCTSEGPLGHVDFRQPGDSKTQKKGDAKGDKADEVLHLQDFGWKTHGTAILDATNAQLCQMVDSHFDLVYSMTNNSLNGREVDTLPFRRAVWYYVLSIKGCKRDDYDYAEVNRLLNIDLKRFIKKVSCTPEMITKADGWVTIGASFAASEKLHINLLATEARRQCELLHAFNAVNRFLSR